jgi:16S rRNA (uracil1498-N3)-methyltransferase
LVDVTDGAGLVARCTVVGRGPDGLRLRVGSRHRVPPPRPRLVVAQALAKGDRGELAVEVLTEIGVDEILPWSAARSVVRWTGHRGDRAVQRWRAAAAEAAKQSRRAWWPVVGEAAGPAGVAARLAGADLGIVLDPVADEPLTGAGPPAAEIVVVVGPEGGLTPEEATAFAEAGAVSRRLGPTILRTSTAGLAAASVLLAGSGRWAGGGGGPGAYCSGQR